MVGSVGFSRQAQNKFSSSFFSSWEKNRCPRAPGEAGKGNLTFRTLELRRWVWKTVYNMEICLAELLASVSWGQCSSEFRQDPGLSVVSSPLWGLHVMPVNRWPAFLSSHSFSASGSCGHILYHVNRLVPASRKGCVGSVSVPSRRGEGHRLPPGPGMKVKWKCQALTCVWLFATSWTLAHRAPLSMEFSRQEYWSG